ncbi:MAG: MBL fold metallo-hydrolase [Cyclobacteriaceae bacterium]
MKANRFLILGAFLLFIPEVSAQSVTVNFLTNQGILIEGTLGKVMIDGFTMDEFQNLGVMPTTEIEKAVNSASPYDNIKWILATHFHGDHFNPELTSTYLKNNPDCRLIATVEVFEKFESLFVEVRDQVLARELDLFGSSIIIEDGFKIKVMKMKHLGVSPWKEAENVAFLVEYDGKKILHLGDAAISNENLQPFNLVEQNIDLAIVPVWGLDPNNVNLIKLLGAKKVIAAHIPNETSQESIQQFKELFGIDVFVNAYEDVLYIN